MKCVLKKKTGFLYLNFYFNAFILLNYTEYLSLGDDHTIFGFSLLKNRTVFHFCCPNLYILVFELYIFRDELKTHQKLKFMYISNDLAKKYIA